MSKEKCTKAELSERIKMTKRMLLAGYTRSHILEYSRDKWNIKRAQVDKNIADATTEIKEMNKASAQMNLAVITSNQWDIYRQTYAAKNFAVARQVLVDIAKLRGLDQTSVNHIIEDQREHAKLTDKELESLLEHN